MSTGSFLTQSTAPTPLPMSASEKRWVSTWWILKAGKVLHRVTAGSEPIRHRTHGAGLTPDETELWISDQEGKKLFIFDATKMPPQPKGHVELSIAGHGWATFSLDGKYAYSHAPDIFDAKTKKHLGTLRMTKEIPSRAQSSSKFISGTARSRQMGNEFGLGRK